MDPIVGAGRSLSRDLERGGRPGPGRSAGSSARPRRSPGAPRRTTARRSPRRRACSGSRTTQRRYDTTAANPTRAVNTPATANRIRRRARSARLTIARSMRCSRSPSSSRRVARESPGCFRQRRASARLAAPQQIVRVTAGLPLPGGDAQLGQERASGLILVQPAAQRGPALDHRLVDQLDRGLGPLTFAGGGRRDRTLAGPDDERIPAIPRTLERRDHTRAHQGRFSSSRRTGDGEQRLAADVSHHLA